MMLGAAALAAALTACDPPFALQYRQTLRPAPTADCVAKALAAAPVVAAATPVAASGAMVLRQPGYRVALRDTTAVGRTYTAIVSRTALPESLAPAGARIAVTYEYMGYSPPTAAEQRRLVALAEEVLAAVRQACTPDAPSTAVECQRLGPPLTRRSCPTT